MAQDGVRERVAELLSDPSLPDPQVGEVDDRWEWAAPLVLDPTLRTFLGDWVNDSELRRPNPDLFGAYVADLCGLNSSELGRRPEGLVDLLTEVALGSPAVLAARMSTPAGQSAPTELPQTLPSNDRRRVAVRVADAFWRLFNRPAVIKLLGQLAAESPRATREENYYWRLVLRYCRDGNLQAVLDEAWHLAWEQQSWDDKKTPEAVAGECSAQLAAAIEPSPSRVHAQVFRADDPEVGEVARGEVRLRTDFALRFGAIRTDEGLITQDAVRSSFNSPFRPFLLASTSVGQEGLDFHPWCHRLVHWNLPGNPVDLEQREGRVHRYKGHAVRRNVAEAFADAATARWRFGDDLWADIFELAHQAARAAGESDLVPHWIAEGRWRVQRHVPMLPYTKEIDAFRRLKRQLAAYRVVFGQPRQEELVALLDNANVDVRSLRDWAVSLEPPDG